MENDAIRNMFAKVIDFGLKGFFEMTSQEIYTHVLSYVVEAISVAEDGLLNIVIAVQSLEVDEAFFAHVFQFSNEGIISFSDVLSIDIEEMRILFSKSGKAVKVFDQKRELEVRISSSS